MPVPQIMMVRGGGTACAVYIPQVQFLDKVVCARYCTTTGACGWTEQRTVEVPQLQRSDKGTMSLLCRSSSGSRGRCHRFSSSPEFVDLPVCNESLGFQRGYGGDAGVGIFRAPPGCPGVERQFSEPSMMKSSSSSRALAQLVHSRLWTYTPRFVNH